MKIYLAYGGALAISNTLLMFALYFLGLHSDVAKFSLAQWIGSCGMLLIGFTVIALGIKARREEAPTDEDFGYGSALGAGVLIVLFSSLFGLATTILYSTVINPEFTEITAQAQIQKWEAAGMTSSQIEPAAKMMRSMMKPPIQAVFGFVFGMIGGTVISLIVAIFLKRSALERSENAPPLVG